MQGDSPSHFSGTCTLILATDSRSSEEEERGGDSGAAVCQCVFSVASVLVEPPVTLPSFSISVAGLLEYVSNQQKGIPLLAGYQGIYGCPPTVCKPRPVIVAAGDRKTSGLWLHRSSRSVHFI